MNFIPRKRSTSSVISLTPLIDCMFLLVVFIMVVARFEPGGGIQVDLPKARTGEAQGKPATISVTVTSDGQIYVDKDLVAPEDLEKKIVEARTAAGDPEGNEVVLVVYGDKDAHHGKVVEVLDAAARVKQKKVTIRTKQ